MPVVVITGASSGIGEATARHLAGERGARCVLVARREDRLERLASEIGNGATWLAADVTAGDTPARIRDHVGADVDVLVNNAGGRDHGTFEEGGWENMRRTMELNFNAQVRISEALLPALRARPGRPAIVNVTSVAARLTRPGAGAYSASKAALLAWTDSLRLEEAHHGVHVGAVLPGFIRTEGFPARELLARRATRWMVSEPERVAAAIAQVAFDGVNERVVPRQPYSTLIAIRTLVPRLAFRATRDGTFTTTPGSSDS